MGSYYLLEFNFQLKNDTPAEVISILEYMISNKYPDNYIGKIPDHPLFGQTEWGYMLDPKRGRFLGTEVQCKLTPNKDLFVRGVTKNWMGEIELFLDWMAQYSSTGLDEIFDYEDEEGEPYEAPGYAFVGYFIYEYKERPTLAYFKDGKAYISEVTSPEITPINVEDYIDTP